MSNSQTHYEKLLAPVYSWMAGGFEAALERYGGFFDRHGMASERSGVALDLGAGCGFQSIPLARRGYAVTAIDMDRLLLDELKANAGALPIEVVEDDLLELGRHVAGDAELVVCMTDTLLHLDTRHDVRMLFDSVHAALMPGGRFVLTFRDLTRELVGVERFIPVRSDADRVLTCFLEYEPDSVVVHDLLYSRRPEGGWAFQSSCYRKLRLPVDWVLEQLREAGFDASESSAENGLATVLAVKPATAADSSR